MKVIHCVSSLQLGGAEKCVKNLVTIQQSRQTEVAIMSFGNDSDVFQAEIEQSGVLVYNISGNSIRRTVEAFRILSSYSTVHIHSAAVIKALTPLLLQLLAKRVIYTIHGEVEPPVNFLRQAHTLARSYINNTFVVSQRIKDGITVRYGWPKDSVEVIKNGVPCFSEPQTIGASDKLNLCVVCRLVALKNIGQLVEAFAQFSCSHFAILSIFGDGPEREYLQQRVIELELQDSIVFHGAVLNENVIYREQDVLLINSVTEGLPMSLLEAMARGIPALSTSVGEIPNVIDNETSGFVYSNDDMEQWSQRLQTLHENRPLLQNLGHAAHRYIKEHFSIEHVSSIYEKNYR